MIDKPNGESAIIKLDLVKKACAKLETAYQVYVTLNNLPDDSAVVRVGFFQTIFTITLREPHPRPDVQAGIVSYLEGILKIAEYHVENEILAMPFS